MVLFLTHISFFLCISPEVSWLKCTRAILCHKSNSEYTFHYILSQVLTQNIFFCEIGCIISVYQQHFCPLNSILSFGWKSNIVLILKVCKTKLPTLISVNVKVFYPISYTFHLTIDKIVKLFRSLFFHAWYRQDKSYLFFSQQFHGTELHRITSTDQIRQFLKIQI